MHDLPSGLALWTSEKVVVKESDTLICVSGVGWLISLAPSLTGCAVYLLSSLSPSLSHLSRHCSVWREGEVGQYLCTWDPLLPVEYLQGGPRLGHVCAHSPQTESTSLVLITNPHSSVPAVASAELSWAPPVGKTELLVS